MRYRCSLIAAVAVLAAPSAAQQPAAQQPAAQQGQPARPADASPQASAPTAQPIPRATFLQDMNRDFSRIDSDRDGKATSKEVEAFQQANSLREILARNRAIFAKLDGDRSGQLSAEEFARFHAQPPKPNSAAMLQRFDSDRDAVITLIEFRAGTLANFDRLDTDKNGIVTPAEMRAGGIIKD